jgi:hypothetical protein
VYFVLFVCYALIMFVVLAAKEEAEGEEEKEVEVVVYGGTKSALYGVVMN